MKIAIMESLGIPGETLQRHMAPFIAAGHTFAVYERTTETDALIEEACDADIMLLANMPMPGYIIDRCPLLKFIDVAFTGVDHVGLEAAKRRNIAVSNASGYSTQAVSELALGMALSLIRHVPELETCCRSGENPSGIIGREICGKTIGIIGCGKIGLRSAELFHALGAHILAQSRSYHKDFPTYIEQVDQEHLLRRSDIVLLHCPLNDSTRGIINRDTLSLMKPTSLLINVARGPIVVEKDLADALNSGCIAGAGIDVFDQEPPLEADNPLLNSKNILVTPHVAFATKESMLLRADIVFANLKAWMDGRQQNIVLAGV